MWTDTTRAQYARANLALLMKMAGSMSMQRLR